MQSGCTNRHVPVASLRLLADWRKRIAASDRFLDDRLPMINKRLEPGILEYLSIKFDIAQLLDGSEKFLGISRSLRQHGSTERRGTFVSGKKQTVPQPQNNGEAERE